MNFRNKPELHERLAAEYALGTLRGAARRRFERWMREDAALAMAVARWETRLAPMAGAVQPVPPPAHVWRRIRERAQPAGPSQGLWNSVGFWRNLGLAASGMAAALLVAPLLISPQTAQPPAALAPAGTIVASYLAILSDAKTQKPVLVVSAGRKSDQLWFRALDPAIQVAGKSLELWALPRSGAPKSLGLVAGGKASSRWLRQPTNRWARFPRSRSAWNPRAARPPARPPARCSTAGPA